MKLDEDCHEDSLGRYRGVYADEESIPNVGELSEAADTLKLSTRLRFYTVEEDALTIVPQAHLSHYSARSVQEAVERDAWEAHRIKTA